MARDLFEQRPEADSRRRIVELRGMDPETILAARDARPVLPPPLHSTLDRALSLARDDAAALGRAEVRPENLLVGLLRGGGPPLYFLKSAGSLDVERFHADLAERLGPAAEHTIRPDLPMHADAHAALQAAVAVAAQRRAGSVEGLHLLHALTLVAHGPVAEFLARYGASTATVNERRRLACESEIPLMNAKVQLQAVGAHLQLDKRTPQCFHSFSRLSAATPR